jgi:hypothetical protein
MRDGPPGDRLGSDRTLLLHPLAGLAAVVAWMQGIGLSARSWPCSIRPTRLPFSRSRGLSGALTRAYPARPDFRPARKAPRLSQETRGPCRARPHQKTAKPARPVVPSSWGGRWRQSLRGEERDHAPAEAAQRLWHELMRRMEQGRSRPGPGHQQSSSLSGPRRWSSSIQASASAMVLNPSMVCREPSAATTAISNPVRSALEVMAYVAVMPQYGCVYRPSPLLVGSTLFKLR